MRLRSRREVYVRLGLWTGCFLSVACAWRGVRGDDPTAAVQPASAAESAAQQVVAEAATYLQQGEHGVGGTLLRVFYPRSPQRDRIEAALDKPVDLEFIDTELSQALSYLNERYEIPIRPDYGAMSEVGLGLDTQISLVISGISLANALDVALGPLDLDYAIRNDVLHVTTRAAAERIVESRLYDLRGLPPEYTPEVLAQVLRGGVQPDSWRPAAAGPLTTDAARRSNWPVPHTVGTPDKPAAPGGAPQEPPVGTIEPLPGALLVTHNQRTHREVAGVLDQLARFAEAGAAADGAAATFDREQAARQILRLSSVVHQLQTELAHQHGEAAARETTHQSDVERLQAEIASWQKTYRDAIVELEKLRAELKQLPVKPQ
jgi:hypothetical protein